MLPLGRDVRAVLGVDPGQTTGFARYVVGKGFEGAWELGHEAFMDWAAECVKQWGAGLVLCSEVYTVQSSRVGTPYWSIGQHYALEWLCRRHGALFVPQTPGDAKGFAPNALLKELGWYTKLDHGRDATRHLALWCARAGWYKGNGRVEPSGAA